MKHRISYSNSSNSESIFKSASLKFTIVLTALFGTFLGAYYRQSPVSANAAPTERQVYTYAQTDNRVVTYQLTSSATSWTEAEAEAVSLGGHLVAINDQAEQTFLINTYLGGDYERRPLWIGINDRIIEGTYVWSSGEPVTYQKWSQFEPNHATEDEDYGTMNWSWAYSNGPPYNKGDWNDSPPNGTMGEPGNTDGPYFGIIEIGGGCSYTISATTANVAAAGGSGSFTVSNSAGCTWAATSNADWLTTTSTGSGNGTVNFTAAANTGARRTGIITVGNQTFTVTQAGIGENNERKVFAADGLSDSRFGTSVAISGDTAVIGAPETRGFNGSNRSGAAYVFVRNANGNWTQQAKLTASGGPSANEFGRSVAISGDTIIVSSVNDQFNSNVLQGAAYVFTRTGTTWTQQQRLTASDGAAYDQFGSAVAMTENTVVIGAAGSGSSVGSFPQVNGAAYVFVKNGATWTQQQKLAASDGAVNDLFGASVGISGETVIVGAYLDDVGANADQGSAYIFSRNGTVWTQQQKITASNSSTNKLFGRSVSIDGSEAFVGENSGSIASGDPGAVYVFSRNGTVWSQQQRLTANDGLPRDLFGEALAFSGGKIYVGAGGDDIGNNSNQGSLYIFVKNGTVWEQKQKFTASDGAADDNFGSSIAVSGNNFIVGAFRDDNPVFNQGSAYIFRSSSNRDRTFDFDGDGKADVSVFRPSNGAWYLQQSTSGFSGISFGASTDLIAPADYDGDGKTDVAVYRNGTWYLQRSQLGFTGIAFGASGDVPMPADFDGDGKSDVAVFRPSTGTWYIQQSTAGFIGVSFGANGDNPAAADYDADGKADIAVFRPSTGTWYLQRSQLGFTGIAFGANGDKPVPADYDADGKADVAVFRAGTWYLQQSTQGFTGISFGAATDLPTAADYDGDGKADVAVFRPSNGTWYLNRSQSGFTGVAFGAAGDKPVPNAFIP